MNLPQILSASELDESRAAPGPAWPTPTPLGSPTPPSLNLAAAIPLRLGTFRAYGDGLAEALQVPPDAVFSLAISIASGCAARAVETRAGPRLPRCSSFHSSRLALQRSAKISIQRNGGWPARMYFVF